MYICICHAVTDDQIAAAVDNGARTVEDVSASTRAGTSCTTCHDHVEELIEARCLRCPLAAMQVA